LEKLLAMVEAQGGDPKLLEKGAAGLPRAPETITVAASRGGYVQSLNAELVGQAAMVLGAGRATLEDRIDPAVGVVLHSKSGDSVQAGQALATVHGRTKGIGEARLLLDQAYQIVDLPPVPRRLVIDRIAGRIVGGAR
jgi:pyrimidine-nucleoside phosphorylase